MDEVARRAKKKYKKKIEELRVELYPTDADIKAHLAALGTPKAAFVKRLIREDIARTKSRHGANTGVKTQGENQ